jgi:hypothetical protein
MMSYLRAAVRKIQVRPSRLAMVTPAILIFFSLALAPHAAGADALNYFQNYFVTGDAAYGSVGLRGTGVGGKANGSITISGVPCTSGVGPSASIVPCTASGAVPADVVAAYLYWETEETAATPSAMNGLFDNKAIVGTVLGNPNNPACWSSGGTNGANGASGRVYRADVLAAMPPDNTGHRATNSTHQIQLPDSGGNGNGLVFLTDGATLVLVYRIQVPGKPHIAPLRAVVLYDGSYTLAKGTAAFTQTIGGFYQAGNGSGGAAATMTPIAGNGQSGFVETVSATPNNGTIQNFNNPFTGSAGSVGRWDSPTLPINLPQDASSYYATVTSGSNQVCLTFAALVTSTVVTDPDYDGLLTAWETKGLHLNPGDATHPATFGGCADYPSDPCVNLPAMGANPTAPDIFVEIDWMSGGNHTHVPKFDSLNTIATTFRYHGINLHFDVGNNYQPTQINPATGSTYGSAYGSANTYLVMPFVPAAYAQGGEVIAENGPFLCPNAAATNSSQCAFPNLPYSVLSWKTGLHGIKDGNIPLNVPAHFALNRKDAFHYVFFGHALGIVNPKTPGTPKSTSGVADHPGGDVLITMGLWRSDNPGDDQTGSVLQQAGTLMHELGHNLNLGHAGLYRTPNCMPNYPSVMNYQYQARGLTDANGFEHVDYSSGKLLPMNKGALSEAPGFLGLLPYQVRYYGPAPAGEPATATRFCDGSTIQASQMPMMRLESPGPGIDWNNNGKIDPINPDGTYGTYALDVNFSGSPGDGVNPAAGLYFVDSNDWANLDLQQVGIRRNILNHSLADQTDMADQTDFADQADFADQTDMADQADFADQADMGDAAYDDVISSLDPTSSSQPLQATGKVDRHTLTWGAPGIGQIRHYLIFRFDPAHTTPVQIGSVDGGPPATTYDDVVNDFTDAGAACPAGKTCYNTTYTYFVRSVDVNSTVSSKSRQSSSEVTHLFVIADNQSLVYGTSPLPNLSFKPYGDVASSLALTSVTCAVNPTPRNAGTYPITCSGPATTTATDGVSYNVSYNDGTVHTAGALTITPLSITVAAVSDTKTYDGTTTSTKSPTVTPALAAGDTANFTQAFDSRNAGARTLTPSGAVNDGNGGQNYVVTFLPAGGTITPAPLTITATMNSKVIDGNTSAAAVPTVTVLIAPDTVTGLAETYDNPNAGSGKTLSVSTYTVNDGNGGNNYKVNTVTNATGVILWNFAGSPLKSPANLGSAVPISWTLQNGSGAYVTDLTTLVKLESVFNGSTPQTGGCVASLTGTSQTLYSLPNGATGNSSFRIVSPGYQFNWDTSTAAGTGKGCYTVKITLNDGSARMTNAVQLK